MTALHTIGFIGLGAMGSGMARNLLKGGFAVSGYDLSREALDGLAAAGATAAASPREAAEGADLVIAMLPNAPHVEGAMTGDDGILAADSPGRRIMNCSTIDPAEAKRLAGVAEAGGWRYIDCPVGRTQVEAAEGKSLFMLAGAAADKEAVRPALEAMGTAIVDCGEVGQGSTIKIVNNYVSIIASVATAECLRLAEAGGVTPEAASEVINQTVAVNGHVKIHYPRKVLAGDLTPGFAVDHAYKDLGIGVAAFEREGIPCFMGAGALKAYETAREQGRGAKDWSDLFNMVGDLWRGKSGG